MPSIGPAEILVILVVALLVFGPNRMPEIGRQLAKGVREFRRVQQHLTSELHDVVSEFDTGDDGATAVAQSGSDPVPTLPPKDAAPSSSPPPAPSPRAVSARTVSPPAPSPRATPPTTSPPATPAPPADPV